MQNLNDTIHKYLLFERKYYKYRTKKRDKYDIVYTRNSVLFCSDCIIYLNVCIYLNICNHIYFSLLYTRI